MDAASKTVTVAAVNPSQSFVYCFGHAPSSEQSNIITCQLAAADQIRVDAGAGNSQSVFWGLVEFALNAFVQRGTATLSAGATSTDIPIANVNLARTFVLVESRTGNVDLRDRDEQRTVRAHLTAADTLHIERSESGMAIDITYQVIQLNAAQVQSGLYTLTATTGVVPIAAVDLTRAVLFFNLKASADCDGVENRYYVRGKFSAANAITFNRLGAVGSADISYFAVELNEVSVQSGTVSTTAPHTQTVLDATLPTAVNTARTLPVISNTIIETLLPTSDSDQDSGRYSGVFTSETNLRIKRSDNSARPSDVDWFTVQFAGIGL